MGKSMSLLNNEKLIASRNAHFDKMGTIFDGNPGSCERPFLLTGIIGRSERDLYKEPELWVEEATQSLLDRAERVTDTEVFRPLCVEYTAYGVHFVDKILGAEVFYDEATKMWNSKYITTPIGKLEYPDLENSETWKNAKKAALAFVKQDVRLPLFGLPTIASALNIAVNLYGSEIMIAMIEEPENARHDLEVINQLLCDLHRWYIDTIPAYQLQPVISFRRTQPPGYGQICGCTTQLLSGALYNEFIAPLDDALLSVYPNGGMIHLCGSHIQHIPIWKEIKSFRAFQLNDRASEDLEEYFKELREDQVIYLKPTDTMTIEKALEITGGKRIIFMADIKRP